MLESSQLLLGETLETLGLRKPPRIQGSENLEDINEITWVDHGTHYFPNGTHSPQPGFLILSGFVISNTCGPTDSI